METKVLQSILNVLPQNEFDTILEMAMHLCGSPFAIFSARGSKRTWVKTDSGGDFIQFESNIGIPVFTNSGILVGTLHVSDEAMNQLTESHVSGLKTLSRLVAQIIDLKAQVHILECRNQKNAFSLAAVENVSNGIVVQDATGTIVDFNPAANLILGLSAEEMNGKNSMDASWSPLREDGRVFPGNELPPMVCLKTGRRQLGVILGIHRPNNEVRWLNCNSVPIFMNGGQTPSHVVTSFTDFTDQFESTIQMRRSQDELRFILNSLPILIGHWDSNLHNMECNEGFSKYANTTPNEIKGKHFKDALGPEIYEMNKENLENVSKGQMVHFFRTLKAADGSDGYFDATYVPNIKDGKVVSFLTVLVDITRLKNNEIERQKLELQLMNASRLSALGEMASGIAHEVNNPLAIILGRVALLKKRFLSGTVDPVVDVKHLDGIEKTADRIVKIVKGLRTYSRNAENDPFESTSVRSILDDTLVMCSDRFKLDEVQIIVNCESELTMECRPAQISQVLMNLLSNSYDAISASSPRWIRIDVYEDASNVKIKCVDSGNGIPKDIADKIMQPFFTTKGVGKGTGLGLSISIGIVQCHNGRLTYLPGESNTTFVVELPKHQIRSISQAA